MTIDLGTYNEVPTMRAAVEASHKGLACFVDILLALVSARLMHRMSNARLSSCFMRLASHGAPLSGHGLTSLWKEFPNA